MIVKRKPKPLLILVLISVFLIIIGGLWLFLCGPVNSFDHDIVEVEISSGTSTKQISSILKEKNLIRSKVLFGVYVKMNQVSSLKAGTYQFRRDMSLSKIISNLEKGSKYNPHLVVLTFQEGKRITDYAKIIEVGTNHTYDEVIAIFKDKEYMRQLISKYWFLTDAILNDNIYYPLEGYLAPDTYHFDHKDVEIKTIIETMLDENDKKLLPYKDAMINGVHDFVTMASIVELEGTNTEKRKMIVGIFENRLHSGMNMGSDVTTYYGLQADMTKDLSSEQFLSDNPYNTRSTKMIGKLPVGPICAPSISSIEASVHPTDNDYLFFVADKHGNIYYTRTNKEHDQKVAEIKAKGDWIW